MNALPFASDQPTLSATHRARLEERRREVEEFVGTHLPPGTSFVWELGCGHGHFLTEYARAHPERVCVGVDVELDRIERALRKRDRAKLANLHFVRTEARLFLDVLPATNVISDTFILFPDPWPKLRHHKHRILQPDFLAALARRAAETSRLYFRTDYRPYFDSAVELLASDPHWERVIEPWPFEFATVFQQRAASYDSLVAKCRS